MTKTKQYTVGQLVSIEYRGKVYKVHVETLFHFIIEDVATGNSYIYSPDAVLVRPNRGTKWGKKHLESYPIIQVGKQAADLFDYTV